MCDLLYTENRDYSCVNEGFSNLSYFIVSDLLNLKTETNTTSKNIASNVSPVTSFFLVDGGAELSPAEC